MGSSNNNEEGEEVINKDKEDKREGELINLFTSSDKDEPPAHKKATAIRSPTPEPARGIKRIRSGRVSKSIARVLGL